MAADDHQCRRLDVRIAGAKIHGGDRLAASDIAGHLCRHEYLAHAVDGLRGACAEAFCEPALHIGVDHFRQSLLSYEFDAIIPGTLVGVEAIGVGEHEFFYAVGRIGSEPLADHAAHREAAPIDLFYLESVEHREYVATEALHGVGTLWYARLAVATPVVPDEPEVLRELRGLVIPHMQVGAERVRQHQHGRAVTPFDLDVDRAAVIGINHRHESPPLRYSDCWTRRGRHP